MAANKKIRLGWLLVLATVAAALAARSLYTLLDGVNTTTVHYVKVAVFTASAIALGYLYVTKKWRGSLSDWSPVTLYGNDTDQDNGEVSFEGDRGGATINTIAFVYIIGMFLMTFAAIWPASHVVHWHGTHADLVFFEIYIVSWIPLLIALALSKLPAKKVAEFHR